MNILNQITLILVSAIFFGAIFRYLKQPVFLAYIVVGLFVGTYFINGVENLSSNNYLEVVVSILLFISGLSINLKHLNDLGQNTLVKNTLAFFIISFFFYFCLSFIGFEIIESIILSVCLSLSSSVILSKISSEDLLHRSLFNKIASSHLLVQSVFLIFILVFLGAFSGNQLNEDFYNLFVNNLLKTLILVVNLYLVSKYIISRLVKFISSSNEYLFLFVVGFGFGVVSLFKFLNLSYELGALVAGVMLSIHNFSLEVSSKLKVIKDISLLGFFVFLGSGLNYNILSSKILLIFILLVLVVASKIIINLYLEKLFHTSLRDSFYSSLSLTSLSEFSLVLVILSFSKGLLNSDIYSVIGFVYIILSVINIYLIKHRNFLYNRYFDSLQIFKSAKENRETISEIDVLLLGCGKLGFDFLENYKYLKNKFLVVDYDNEVLKKLHKFKINNIYGDIGDNEFFESLPYLTSKLIYISIFDKEITREILKKLKSRKYSGVKIAVSYSYEDTLEFYRLGADYVVMPDYVSGKFVSDLTLNLGFDSKKYLSEKNLNLESLKVKESHNF